MKTLTPIEFNAIERRIIEAESLRRPVGLLAHEARILFDMASKTAFLQEELNVCKNEMKHQSERADEKLLETRL